MTDILLLTIIALLSIGLVMLLFIVIRTPEKPIQHIPVQYQAFLEFLQKIGGYIFIPHFKKELFVDVYKHGNLTAIIFLSEHGKTAPNPQYITIEEGDYYYKDRIENLIEAAKPPL